MGESHPLQVGHPPAGGCCRCYPHEGAGVPDLQSGPASLCQRPRALIGAAGWGQVHTFTFTPGTSGLVRLPWPAAVSRNSGAVSAHVYIVLGHAAFPCGRCAGLFCDLCNLQALRLHLHPCCSAVADDVAGLKEHGAHVLVGSPGRIWDVMQRCSGWLQLSALEVLVLDEADRLLDMGFKCEPIKLGAACKVVASRTWQVLVLDKCDHPLHMGSTDAGSVLHEVHWACVRVTQPADGQRPGLDLS